MLIGIIKVVYEKLFSISKVGCLCCVEVNWSEFVWEIDVLLWNVILWKFLRCLKVSEVRGSIIYFNFSGGERWLSVEIFLERSYWRIRCLVLKII